MSNACLSSNQYEKLKSGKLSKHHQKKRKKKKFLGRKNSIETFAQKFHVHVHDNRYLKISNFFIMFSYTRQDNLGLNICLTVFSV